MPRRRFRDPDPQVRDRNKWDASGQPAIGGLSRIGGAGRGGTSTIVPRGGGRGDGGQVRIEHITLHAEANQTVASGGAGVSWDRIATAPTELRGFETCADTIGSTGSVVAIPIDVTGFLVGMLELPFASTVDVDSWKIERVRDGSPTTFLADLSGTAIEGVRGPFEGWVKFGDTLKFTLDPASDVDIASPAWVQLGVWDLAEITSSVPQPSSIATLHGYGEPASRPTEATVNGTSAITAGDVLVAFVASAEPTITPPAGWTLQASNGSGDSKYQVYTRVAQAGDSSASWTWSATGGVSADLTLAVTIAIVGGIDNANPLDGTPGVNYATVPTTTTPVSMTSTQSDSVLLLMGFSGNQAGVTHSVAGMTEVDTYTDGGGDELSSVWQGSASGGAESKTLVTSGSVSSAGAALIALRRA